MFSSVVMLALIRYTWYRKKGIKVRESCVSVHDVPGA